MTGPFQKDTGAKLKELLMFKSERSLRTVIHRIK